MDTHSLFLLFGGLGNLLPVGGRRNLEGFAKRNLLGLGDCLDVFYPRVLLGGHCVLFYLPTRKIFYLKKRLLLFFCLEKIDFHVLVKAEKNRFSFLFCFFPQTNQRTNEQDVFLSHLGYLPETLGICRTTRTQETTMRSFVGNHVAKITTDAGTVSYACHHAHDVG